MSPLARGDVSVSWQRGSRLWLWQTTISIDLVLKSKLLYLSADVASVGIVRYYPTVSLREPPPLARGGLSKSARELSLNSVKLEIIKYIILLVLSFTAARALMCLILTQVATLFRHSSLDSKNFCFISGNIPSLKFNISAKWHLPPNHGGRPCFRSMPRALTERARKLWVWIKFTSTGEGFVPFPA